MRRQLALVAIATTTLVVLALLIPLGKAVTTIPYDRAVRDAQRTAESLATALSVITTPNQARYVEQTSDMNERRISVWLANNTVAGAPFVPDEAANRSRTLARAGQARVPGGVEVLQPVIVREGTAVVRVFVPTTLLRKGIVPALAVLSALALLLILIAVAVFDRLARAIVKPIGALATTTRLLEAGDLSARVHPGGPPEVKEVAVTLNRLAKRIGELLVLEREAIADLSHRLRTPITALRLDAEALSDPIESKRLVAAVDEVTAAVDQLIRQARHPTTNRSSTCDLVTVASERFSFWSVLAEDQGRAATYSFPESPCRIGVAADELSAALDALLGNVFSHTPEGTAFRVGIAATRTEVDLWVEDDGPGVETIPADLILGRGESGAGSTGLGLDIARRTAINGNGYLLLTRNPDIHGLRVTMKFERLASDGAVRTAHSPR